MIQRDYLIIGAGIAGACACEAIRKHDKRGSVTLVGSEAYAPYKRWLLSKSFLREKTIVPRKYAEVDERWYAAHKIDARFNATITQLNIDRRVAVLGNGESIEFNKACLAMGSRPGRPPVAGVGLGNVIYLRSMRDAFALREMAEHEKNVTVVGGGLLACEVAASLRQMKMKVSVMHRHSTLLNRYLDFETEEKGIYAVGDLAFYPDRLMGGMRRQTHWENAREQGLVAGANMTGKKRIRYEQLPYFWTEMFDLRLDFVGDFTIQPTRVDL